MQKCPVTLTKLSSQPCWNCSFPSGIFYETVRFGWKIFTFAFRSWENIWFYSAANIWAFCSRFVWISFRFVFKLLTKMLLKVVGIDGVNYVITCVESGPIVVWDRELTFYCHNLDGMLTFSEVLSVANFQQRLKVSIRCCCCFFFFFLGVLS